jgi:hypothetical protein
MRGRVYDPRLGRFLSPDPVATPADGAQSRDRYAYVANNPLRFVDPTGFLADSPPMAGGGSSLGAIPAIHLGVSAAGAFLSDLWGNVRFGATALWNGIGWLGAQLYEGARFLGGAAVAGAMWAWREYGSHNAGILPDSSNPFGLLGSLARAITQPEDQGTLYYVGVDSEGRHLPPERFEGEFEQGALFVNGQFLSVDQAARKGGALFQEQPFFMLYSPSVNLVSDTIESVILKLRPSALSRQLAKMLDRSTGPVDLVGYSQGALQVYWALTFAETQLSNVRASVFGPAISSLSHTVATRSSGAEEGRYVAHWNDLVPNLAGGNLTGGWLLPVLLPVRTIGSILFAPTLFSEQHSVHGNYSQ